ncbi:MAG TPA: MATE family efflux transporter [Pyrinomonadaceae bacterium]|nr:MATE family efflux transporter [Pyrinomonadaceae bacterium]
MSVKEIIALLREAVLGSRQDFTEGSIGRAIALLSVPMILEMMMESLFGIVNVFYVARLGADAIATVGLTESMLTIVFGIAIGLSMATTATVARRTGERDPEGAAVAAVQSIIIGIITSLPLAVAGLAFAPTLLRLMGAEAGVIEIGSTYAAIILGGNVCILLLFLINAIFRGAGDAATAMRALWLANIVNIILDPCFIFGLGPFPELGVTGSAIATTIGRGAGVVFQFWVLLSGRSRIEVGRKHLRLDLPVLLKLLRISVGGMFQFLVATASWLGLTRIVAIFGSEALAGYTLSLRILIFAMLPSWGMSNAAATLVGQNLGARKPERAARSVMFAGLSNVVFLAVVALIFVVFTERIIGIFTTDASVIAYGVTSLRIISYGFIFYGYGMVMVQALNGAGDTFTPTVINLFCYWLFQIPLAYLLAIYFDLGASGVFMAIPIAETLLTVLAVIYFRRGRWKEMKV